MTARRLIPLALALLVGASGLAYAQAIGGTITGTVLDASGAVIQNADVTLTNEASGDVRRTNTNDQGLFTFAAVPVGTYSATIQTAGFKPWKRTAIVLGGGDRINIVDIKLAPGDLSDEITVSVQAELAPIDSGEKSATITQEQLQDLSIVGRSAAELIKILPGVAPTIGNWSNPTQSEQARSVGGYTGEVVGINGNGAAGRQGAVAAYSSSGQQPEAMEIVIDGAHASDPGCNCATAVNPNPEMVGEIKVLQSNFSAEHSKGPVALSIVSRAGGRDFHGSLYTYLRHHKLYSNEWSLNRAGQEKPKNEYYYPGGTVGGPLLIPGTNFNKDRDKVFFFLGLEIFRQKVDTGALRSWVPTEAMKNGDFSNASDYANLGDSYVSTTPSNLDASGRIPAGQIDPNAKILMSLLPSPNADPLTNDGYNYTKALLLDQNGHQAFGRVDVSVSNDTKLFLRYARQRETQPFATGFWWTNGGQVPYPTNIVGNNQSDSVSASLTHVFSPTLTSETLLGYTYINFPGRYEDDSKVNRQALGYTYEGFLGPPDPNVPNFNGGGRGPEIRNFGDFNTFYAKKQMLSVAQNFVKLWGRHTLKAGLFYEWVQNAQPANASSNGQLNLSPNAIGSTGNYFSDLLTGTLDSYNDATPNKLGNITYTAAELYIQDSWKATPRLTIEGGVRLSHLPGWKEAEYDVGIPIWDQAAYDANPNAPVEDRPGYSYYAVDNSLPLEGVKRPFVYLAPRFGFAYDFSGTGDTVVRGGLGVFRFNEIQQFYGGSISGLLGQINQTTDDIMLRDVDSYSPPPQVAGRTGLTAVDKRDNAMPATTSWSLTLQKRLPKSLMLEASYVGNHQFDMSNCNNQCVADINTVALGAMINDPQGTADNYRPIWQYSTLNAVLHDFYANYHSGQIMLSRQKGSLNFMASYTFSKALGTRDSRLQAGTAGLIRLANGQFADLHDTSYGVLAIDRTHVANLAYSWRLPSFEDNKVLNAILGGWQISGVSSLVSGSPLQTVTNGNFALQGTNAAGQTISSANTTGSPHIRVQPVLTCDPREGLSGDQLINASCFALPAPGTNGNYNMPYMTGQWYQNHDLSLFKNFELGGSKKVQLRASAFNVFNHPQRFPDPSNNLTLRYEDGELANANEFGVLPKDNKYGRRIVQFAVKLFF